MPRMPWKFSRSLSRRHRKSLRIEALETRTLLSTFYVNGVIGNVENGSQEAPFSSIHQGIEAALQNPGDDEVVILPKATAPYTTPVAIVAGYNELQIQGYSVFNGDLTIRGGGNSPGDVVIDTSSGDGIYVDAPIAVTIENLTINQSGRHGILYRSQQPLTVQNVHITNHTNNTGIIVQGADLTVRDSLLVNNYQGVWGGIGTIAATGANTSAPGNVTIENTVSRNNINNGAFLRDATGDIHFSNFTATQNGNRGAWVTASASASAQFTNGTYSGNALSGITVENTGNVSISDLSALDNGRNGIVASLNQSLAVDSVTLERNGTLDVAYNPGGGGMHIRPGSGAPITISNSVIRNNRNWGNGGGIEIWGPQTTFMANAVISNTVIESNATLIDGFNGRGFGGGVAVIGTSNLSVTNSTIQGNASYSGGGIFVGFGNSINGVFPTLSVENSSILNNNSRISGGGVTLQSGALAMQRSTVAGNAGAAGGIWMTATGGEISNTTISRNTGGAYGGAYLTSRNAFSVVNSTIADNLGFSTGGLYSTGSSVQILNSIVSQNGLNSSEGFAIPFVESDLGGRLRSLGYNVFGEVSNVVIDSDRVTGPGPHSTDLFGIVAAPLNAMLGPLQNNGGPTLTHALLPQSPAINGGAVSQIVPATDQRGFSRAGQTDIGAFENQAPVGVDDSFTTNEDTQVTLDVLSNDSERDGESFQIVQIQNVQGGTAVLNLNGTVLFTPHANFNGAASFNYVLEDASGLQTLTSVSVTVLAVNDVPVAQNDTVVIDEDMLAQIGALTNDSDADGDTLTVWGLVTQPANGSVQLNADGTFTYRPTVNFHGVDSFTYRISDGNGGLAEATVSIVVNSVNDVPVAVADSVTTTEDMPVTFSVTNNDSDVDGDSLSVSQITTPPANGAVTINSAGQLVYTPNVDFSGVDTFVYQISDGSGGTTTAAVTVTVISRQAQMDSLKSRVQQLFDAGVIDSKQSRTLQGYLKFSKDPGQTLTSLTQFQTEVQKLINNETLSPTIVQKMQMLIADAEKLKQSVSIVASGTGGPGGGNGKGPK